MTEPLSVEGYKQQTFPFFKCLFKQKVHEYANFT